MRKLCALLTCLAVWAIAGANPTGDEIVRQINALKEQPFDYLRMDDPAYVQQYWDYDTTYQLQREALIWKLYSVDPYNQETPAFLEQRWAFFVAGPGQTPSQVQAEIAQVLRSRPSPSLEEACDYSKIWRESDPASEERDAYAFAQKYPANADTPNLLFHAAGYRIPEDHKRTLWAFIAFRYPKFAYTPTFRGALTNQANLGTPFSLHFKDLMTGARIDTAAMNGKVVVVYFFATWCSDCLATRPVMMDFYGQFHPKGVEFIGISLDLPRAESRVKDYLQKKQIPWPVFYQGDKFAPFSSSWGVLCRGIPLAFAIDKQGNFQGFMNADALGFEQSFGQIVQTLNSR